MTDVHSPAVVHGWTSQGGLTFHHLRWGPTSTASEPPVLCLHGVTGQAWAWNGAAPLLAASGPVVALDLRGHGGSSWAPDRDYATATLAADVVGLLDSWAIGPVDVVGASWGGLVGAAVAAARPDLVRRLVVVDVPPVFTQAVDDVPVRPGAFPDLASVVAFEAAANRWAPYEHVAVLAAGSVRPGPAGLERTHDPLFFTEWPFRAEDHWDAVRGVRAPALVVRAEDSFVLSADLAAAEAEILGAELVEIGPSGHLVAVDQPERFAETVVAFLGGG